MRRTFLLAHVWLMLIATTALAQPIKTESVTYKSGDETVSGYLALPETAGAHPAVVVIHEWWGLNEWIKEQAQKFAAQAYDPALAYELAHGLPQDRAVRDLRAAFAYLASRPDVHQDKIGSIGWCMGGSLSLDLAIREPRLAACVVNYGAVTKDPDDIQRIQAPVLGIFGADDRSISASTVEAFEKAMRGAGKSIEVKTYEGAGHAFENPNNKLGYREAAANDAWARTLVFFSRTLR
jgi:carboxymethylenebutenolidase